MKRRTRPYNKKESTHRHERNKLIWSLFIAFIMITSIIGFLYVFNPNSSSSVPDQEYKGKPIRFDGQFYYVENLNLPFYNHPFSAESVELDFTALSSIAQSKTLTISIDPYAESVQGMELFRFDMNSILPSVGVTLTSAVQSEHPQYTFDIVTCDDANETHKVIVLEEVQNVTTKIYEENNCIHIQGQDAYDFELARDRILYGLTGTIQ